MKQNYLMNCLVAIQRRLFSSILCLMAIAFVWQGGFSINHAIANPLNPMHIPVSPKTQYTVQKPILVAAIRELPLL